MKSTEAILAEFNVVAKLEYNKAYEEFEPKFQELMYEYESGPVASVDFPFFGFLTGMEEFTGSRIHQQFPDGWKFTVRNKEWDMSVDIPRKDIERAASIGTIQGLNPYRMRIAEIPKLVKDHPIELAFDMLEAGDASTFGTTFDGQLFFDTDHAYDVVGGTQSNIITTGSGVTVANLITDLDRAVAVLEGFHYFQGGTTTGKRRKLNKSMSKLLVVCPIQLAGVFGQVNTKATLASSEDNHWKGRFEVLSMPFTDATDWYLMILDEGTFKPFLHQMEKEPELDTPTLQDENARERKIFTWGAYKRDNVAYGAWWKAVMIQNT